MSRLAAMERGMKMLQEAVAAREATIVNLQAEIKELKKPKPKTKKVKPRLKSSVFGSDDAGAAE